MQPHEPETKTNPGRIATAAWPLVAGAIIGLAGIGYGVSNNNRAEELVEAQTVANGAVADMQKQVQSLNERISFQEAKERESAAALAAAQEAAQRASKPEPAPATTPQATAAERPRRIVAKKKATTPVEDPRFLELEKKFSEKFSEHDEKLADTQRMVESARTDLENQLNTKSDELSGSIAHTSEEVALLRKRGERDYFEFDLMKSKQLQRVGPVSLALRKSDTKHKRYNMNMVVDDNQLEKKNVNLLEPVYFTTSDASGPLELVVNRVDKDRVSGYISVPKYKRSELTSAGTNRSSLTLQGAPTAQE